MNKYLRNILEGMAGLCPAPRGYNHPTGGGFARDAISLRSDFSSLSKDMNKAIKKHEQTQVDSLQVR